MPNQDLPAINIPGDFYNPGPDSDPIMGGTGQARQTLTVTDLICEGPIEGLVDGPFSIFLDDDRAVPDTETTLSTADGPITVALANGSTTATISSNAPDDLILEAEGKKYLIVKEIAGPIAVTVSRLSGSRYARGRPRGTRHLAVDGGASSILASYFTGSYQRYSPATYVAVTLVPTSKDSEDLRIPIVGWLTYTTSGGSGNQSVAFFLPGSAKVNSGFETALGSYKLFIDRSVEIASINNKTLTLAAAWTDTTASYSFNVTGGLKNDIADVQDTLLTTYGGVQTQFRAGTRDQTPFTGQGGEGSTAISNNPSAGGAIEWTSGYSDNQGNGAQAAKELIGGSASGFNLTASQLREIDEARITWQYPSLYAIDGGGDEKHSSALYLVELAIKRGFEDDYDASFILMNNLKHSAKSKSALSFNIVVDMAQYQPLSDFKFIISRKTDHQNDGYDQKGIRKKDWANQSSASLSSTTAIIKEKLSHPYSAMAKVSFSSKEFQNMPKRSYHLRGAMVRVPSNYVTREENGTNQAVYTRDSNGAVQNAYQDWDGSFRDTLVYTNNPAWVFYDILVNNRYGLGDFLSKSDIDIYQLYRIGRYCDELVLDGKGGYEPRFTSNIFLTKQADAFKILKDMMTTFRSLLYFIDGQITAIQDAPSGPVYNFSKSNVIDGSFNYEGTGSKTRVNQVIVSWNNPDNNYKLEPLLVEDRANIAKTGKIISQDAAAFGCASQGQALRYGRWKLWTAANQTELVKFATGLNGAYLFPGDVVNVQDADKNNVRYSGRLSSNMEKGLTLSQTFPAGIIAELPAGLANADYSDPVVMACDVVLPATFSQNECLFEKGGTGRGIFVGVLENSGTPQLVYRFSRGDASTQATSALAICEKVAISTIPEFDGGSHTVTWEAYPTAPGRGRLWIDGRLIIDATTPDASGTESGQWGGSNLGGYGLQGSSIAGAYASVQPWSGVLQSSLRVYNDQQISYTNNTVNLDSPVTLNANSTYKLSVVFIEPSAFLAQESATIDSVDYVRGDLIKSAFIDSNGNGTYTLQAIDSEADSVNAKATASGTDALLLAWSDYTTVEQRTVSTSAGSSLKALTVSEAFAGAVTKSHIWVLEETDNSGATVASSAQPYKILAVTESEKNTYEIIAVAHYDEKFSAIETDFTTYIADPVLPRITSTDVVPKVSNFYSTISASSEQAGQTVQLFWAPPATLATSSTVAESDAPATGNTQTTLDGGASNYYEFLSGYELHHDLPGTPSPMRFGKDARSVSFSGIPEGFINFALRTINTLDNKSKPTLITTTGVGKYSAKGQRYPYGVLVGGTIDVGSFVDLSGLYQFEDYAYTMKPGGNALTITNNSPTAALWQQDCSDLPAITFTPGDGNVFESSLYYILLDSSDSSDRLKLVKLYDDTTHGVQYWYDAGTGNATNRWGSNLTGTISKAAGSSVMVGSGTAFTTQLQVGDLIAGGGGNNPLVLGRVVSIQSNTLLELDKAHGTFSISNASIRIPNIRIDTVNDVIISSVHKDSGGFVHTPLNTINTSIKTVIESADSALAYYWPSNSVNGDYITETVAGVHGEAVGTAPTVSTESPVGNSIVNDDGVLLLSDTQADALESGGFSASYWFKSTSSGGNAFARLLTRDQNNNWAMGVKQDEAADDVQNLIIWVNGPSGATLGDAITLNKWHHAGIVYDGTNFKVFLDGEEVYNKTGYAPITANPRPIAFGVNVEEAPATQNKFIGQFTEIKFFNDPISNAQMRNLYRLPGSTVAGTSDTPIQLGGENGSVLKVTSEGLSLGNTTFASAPFRVDMAGNLNATSATVTGTITGASVIADTVTIGGGTAGDVVTGSDIIGAGSVNLNPNMTLVAPDGRPQGVLSAYGSASIGNISYQDAAKTVLKLHTATGSDVSTGAVWPAFRINPDAKYKVLVRWKATAASSTGAYLRIEELDTELPIGKTHISHLSQASEAAVTEDTRQIDLWNNDAIGTSYVDQIFDYTPTSTAKWASALALNWSGMGTSEMHIDLLYIVEDTSVKSQGSVGGWTIDSDAIFAGTKKTTDDFSASAGDITISSTGAIRANKFLLKADGDASFKGDISAATGTLSNSIQIGSGESVFKADSNGVYLGNETFANAEFSVTPAGALKATSAEVTGSIKAGSLIGGSPIPDILEQNVVSRSPMTAPRISMRGGAVYYGILEDDTVIYKNDDVIALNQTKGTRDTFSTAVGDIIHSNKPVVLHSAQGSLPSLSQTGTEFTTVTGSATNQNYFFYSPYGDTTVRLLKNEQAAPNKSAGGTLIDWSDHNEFDKVHAVTALEAGYRYEIVAPGNTDFTGIGAANSNAGTQFNASGAGTGTGTAKIVEGWKKITVASDTVTENTVTTSNNTPTYTWIKADSPVVIYRNSGGTDHAIVRPAARELFTYDGYVESKFNPSDATASVTQQSATDWRYTRNATVKLGAFDNGDGDGADGTSHFPWEFAGDTYCLPHTISGYQIATIESAIINAYYWSGSAWTLYKSHDLSEASRENFLGIKEGNDQQGGTGLGSFTVWRFVGTGRFVLRTNSSSPLSANDEYYALGYDSNLRAEKTLRVGKIIASDIAANAITADAIAAGSIAVNKLTGDVTELYPFKLAGATFSSNVAFGTPFDIPAPALGIAKRQRVTSMFDVTVSNSNSSVQNANLFVGIQKLSKGASSVSMGTMTVDTSTGRFYVSGNKLNIVDIAGCISTAADGSGGFLGLSELFYDSVNNRTYVKPGYGSVSFSTGDTLFYNPDGFVSSGTWATVGGVNAFTIVIKESSSITTALPYDTTFASSTTATRFRTIYKFTTNTQGISGSINSVQGTLENIA